MRDAQGDIVPDPFNVPPQHHVAYRHFRYSQAVSNVFDAYRNMFLALESPLDHIAKASTARAIGVGCSSTPPTSVPSLKRGQRPS